jgi:oligopeptidase B
MSDLENSIPPVAAKRPFTIEKHGHQRVDPYYWLADRESAEVLDHLHKEKAYYETSTASQNELKETLYNEIRGRIKEEDQSLPVFKHGYWYETRFKEGLEYPIHVRYPSTEQRDNPELLFDVNAMAEGHEYYDLRGVRISFDNRYALFAEDSVSRRQYTVKIKDLKEGEILTDCIENTTGSPCWSADNATFFYVKKDPETLRAYGVFRHQMGTDSKEDVCVFHEEDETFNVGVYLCKSRSYIIIVSASTLTTEYRILKSDDPFGDFQVFSARQRGLEYNIDHFGAHFYVLTNKDEATNFKLMRTLVSQTDASFWEPFIAHRPEVLLEDFDCFSTFYVLAEREMGLTRLLVNSWDDSFSFYIPIAGETYVCDLYDNPDFDAEVIRYYVNAMTVPPSIYEINVTDKAVRLLKQQEVIGGYDQTHYVSTRLWVNAEDGARIPVSLVRHKNTTEHAPTLLYAYGSYGHTVDPTFSVSRLSLLDRGFVFAIAHVRGSQYLGRSWYDNGKMEFKMNTFNDFISVSRHLIASKIAHPKKLFAMGGSAGGMLMGVIVNKAPELYQGIIAAVPFVDVVTTMLDDSIPLTTGEYDEWGNPNIESDYFNMLAYSPYDNVEEKTYPHIYISTGFHDSQVQYWEPAKWALKLREYNTADTKILLDIDLSVGHGGASGRFEQLREVAKEYAFLIELSENQTI